MRSLLFGALLAGCAVHATTGKDTAGRDGLGSAAEAATPADSPGDAAAFASTVVLEADGPGGVDTYDLIRGVLGPQSLEAPDLYPDNHPGVAHLREEVDPIVGPHFVFLLHRDGDRDRDTATADRQRNEIKAYEGSAAGLKAFVDETLRLTWRFRLDPTLPVSKHFTHVFQLKGVGGDEQQPVITFTGAKKSDGDV